MYILPQTLGWILKDWCVKWVWSILLLNAGIPFSFGRSVPRGQEAASICQQSSRKYIQTTLLFSCSLLLWNFQGSFPTNCVMAVLSSSCTYQNMDQTWDSGILTDTLTEWTLGSFCPIKFVLGAIQNVSQNIWHVLFSCKYSYI